MSKILLILIFLFLLISCKREVPDNCEGEYSFKQPYSTSHPLGRVTIREDIKIEIKIPFNIFNYASDSIVNISRFNKIIAGIVVFELFEDTTQHYGIKFKSINDAFSFNSTNVKLDFTPMQIGTNRVRYYLNKGESHFIATIFVTPIRKGLFYIGLLDSFIEDAFCKADIHCIWGSFSPSENVENLIGFGKIEIPEELREVWMTVEDQGYFILVE